MTKPPTDATGKTAEQRFAEIRKYFLEMLAASGHSRTQLYSTVPAGRILTEREIVMQWAACLQVSVNDILIGIQRAFQAAAERGHLVTSFNYCVPQIVARVNELRETRVGAGPQFIRSGEGDKS